MNEQPRTLRRAVFLLSVLFAATCLSARAATPRHEIDFPDIAGYKTLACDLHMHTVFSDGQVWPSVRVDEAWREGLDALSITDHVEYQPHQADVPTNHNRPYELAAGSATVHYLLMPRGAEITRDTPPGHFNALFLSDVDALDTEPFLEAIKQANEQGAFVFWNHHEWKGPEKGAWMDVHTKMLENGWLHGMEVANGETYYPTAHRWCLEKNLTMIGNSDIHAPDLRMASTNDDHRTLTLVFAKERTVDGLKEALQAGRTVVWFKDQLIGKPEWLRPLVQGSIVVEKPHIRSKNAVWTRLRNISDADIVLARTGAVGPPEIVLPAGTTNLIKIGATEPAQPLALEYTARNCRVGPDESLTITLEVPGP